MKLKRFFAIGLSVSVVCGGLGAGIYYFATKDPTPIHLNPKLYDDYAGYFVFPNGYAVTIYREGDRLLTSTPEHSPRQLFPETETQFFLKGNPARWIFHRDAKGRVDYAVSRWKNYEEKAEKRSTLPANPDLGRLETLPRDVGGAFAYNLTQIQRIHTAGLGRC